jgi:hypothetical protein
LYFFFDLISKNTSIAQITDQFFNDVKIKNARAELVSAQQFITVFDVNFSISYLMNSAFALSDLKIHFYSKKENRKQHSKCLSQHQDILSSLVVNLSKNALRKRDY